MASFEKTISVSSAEMNSDGAILLTTLPFPPIASCSALSLSLLSSGFKLEDSSASSSSGPGLGPRDD